MPRRTWHTPIPIAWVLAVLLSFWATTTALAQQGPLNRQQALQALRMKCT